MHKLFLEFVAAIALTLTAIIALSTGASASDVIVKDAFARASATPTTTTGAVYLTISSPESDRLTAVYSLSSASAHIHQTKDEGGVMKMEMLDSLKIAAGTDMVLAPGGLHIMLVDLYAPLKEGEKIAMQLTFEKAGQISFFVPVGGVADQAVGSSGD